MPRREGWRSFRLMEIPQPQAWRRHNETCAPCREAWSLSATAIHEATHTVVALALGLKVEFTAIDQHREVTATSLEASLYAPLIKRGTPLPALVTRLGPSSLRRHPREVLTAMAAPSCIETEHPLIDDYAQLEATLVRQQALRRDLDPDRILDEARAIVSTEQVQEQVLDLAARLAETGWIDDPGGTG